MSHLCDSTVAGLSVRRENARIGNQMGVSPFPLPPVKPALFQAPFELFKLLFRQLARSILHLRPIFALICPSILCSDFPTKSETGTPINLKVGGHMKT